MSIAVDESTDRTDMAQLCIYVRFFDGVCFWEEPLGLIPLEGHTTVEVIFQKIVSFFNERELDLQKVCLLVNDGTPTMIGRVQGLVARLSAIAPHMQFLHCVIHQSLLCATLGGDLKNTMDTVMNIGNFIRSTSSLQHRLFRQLLADTSAEHTDLFVHNDLRWLSKGKFLDCVCQLSQEIVSFLCMCKHKRATNLMECMLDEQFMAEVHFLCDIFGHLNTLNLEVQEWEKSIADLVERLCAFKKKLTIFTTDLMVTKVLHFPELRAFMSTAPGAHITPVMRDFMTKLTENFTERFQGFSIPIEISTTNWCQKWDRSTEGVWTRSRRRPIILKPNLQPQPRHKDGVSKCRILNSTGCCPGDASTRHNNKMNQQPKLIRRLIHGQELHHLITLTFPHLMFPSSTLIHLAYDNFWMRPQQQQINRTKLPPLLISGLVWYSKDLKIQPSSLCFHSSPPISSET
ncbi:zinc finger BED domain-containing protein 5-like [Thunnus maccoyii]|uniref:zinc finger BED domain-containing protein 5-like n=1 Tax=Thunnus maccoyii TaxID=8240 RepID=UPI001C4B9779|nr:zinc finger BED domain-containing protein 5-like [Thunnus maccoyii]XP_042272645.1 zinc finger BED domain-containing protein 5-like [Thunnus maccoyii]XP_042272646.1 zinc finger BED domain-containing protein 5-like [Thunnus maccoyii]XP_042272647.1 zinc finger BED domain-containing protein 5-like [Thunnus maccoyii]XP_042272648.1 zinc finger BED domain-containing protein 5-like [Thunnus maccoyii]